MNPPWHLDLGDGLLLPCRVTRLRRARRLRLHLGLTELRVTAPMRASDRAIRGFVDEQRDWIRHTFQRLKAQRPQDAIHGDPLPRLLPLRLLDTELAIQYDERSTQRPRISHAIDRLVVHAGHAHSDTDRLQALKTHLLTLGKRELAPRLAALARAHDMRYERVSIRAQRSRWGSCSSRGTISLNYRLLFLPPALAEYVLLHELAHTRHPNHSAAFWQQLERMVAGARELDRQLGRAGGLIPAWTELA